MDAAVKVQGRSYLLLNDARAQVGFKLEYHFLERCSTSSLSDGPRGWEHTEPGVVTGSRTITERWYNDRN